MQLLRQALDKLQAETQVLDDELARAREQAIFSELERAELSHELETVSAQLLASQTSKAELEETISKVISFCSLQEHTPHKACIEVCGTKRRMMLSPLQHLCSVRVTALLLCVALPGLFAVTMWCQGCLLSLCGARAVCSHCVVLVNQSFG